MRGLRRRLFTAALIGTTSLAVAGCSLSPYIGDIDQQEVKNNATNFVSNYDLSYAISLAETYRDAYRDKIEDQAVLNQLAAPALIALGASVIALAAYGAHTDAILGVGLAGGTGFALAQRFSNNQQDLVYLAGMQAMNCAIQAIQPLNLSKGDRDAFRKDLDALSDAIRDLDKSIGMLRSAANVLRKQNATDPLVAVAEQTATEAIETAKRANDAYVGGTKLRLTLNRSGSAMVAAVDHINSDVMSSVHAAQPSLESSLAAVRGLAGVASVFAPGFDFAGVVPARFDDEQGQEESRNVVSDKEESEVQKAKRDAIQKAQAGVAAAIATTADAAAIAANSALRTNAVAETIESATPLETLEACGVEINTSFTVSEQSLAFTTSETSQSKTIVLTGGKPPYSARLTTNAGSGVSVDSPLADERTVGVTVAPTATPGAYAVYVEDSARNDRTITVTVMKGPMAPAPALRTQTTNASTSDKKALNEIVSILEKWAQNLPIDGKSPVKFEALAPEGDGVVTVTATPLTPTMGIPDEDEIRNAILELPIAQDSDTSIRNKYKDVIGENGAKIEIEVP